MKIYKDQQNVEASTETRQYATFMLNGALYGIDVMRVQEVTKPLDATIMYTAPKFIKGLINLRGQITTAIGLKELFGMKEDFDQEKMTIVCRVEDVSLSLLVDKIGDVVEVSEKNFEPTPLTISHGVRSFMQGVYKTDDSILSILNLDLILQELDKKCA